MPIPGGADAVIRVYADTDADAVAADDDAHRNNVNILHSYDVVILGARRY